MEKSKKHIGVYYHPIKDKDTQKEKDRTFYITYKSSGKMVRLKIGKKSEGINEAYCHQKRNEILQKERLGEVIHLKDKKKEIVLFDDIAQRFFDDKKLYIKNIKKNYVGRYNYKIKAQFGNENASNITKQDIENFQKKLDSDGLGKKTINWYVDFIKSIYNHAIEKEIFKGINPVSKLKSLKTNNDRERFLSKDEVNLLKAELSNIDVLNIFVNLALCTGGRLETILSIQKKDINLEQSTITLTDHKNESNYKGFLDNDIKKLLKKHIATLNESNSYLVSKDGKKVNSRWIQNQLKPILDRLFNEGLDSKDTKNRVVIHTLRHTFASQLAIQGTPILTIQKLMNHKDINMTLRYAKLSPDNGRDEVVKLWG